MHWSRLLLSACIGAQAIARVARVATSAVAPANVRPCPTVPSPRQHLIPCLSALDVFRLYDVLIIAGKHGSELFPTGVLFQLFRSALVR